MALSVRVEYAHQRKMRARNTARYRAAHWPIWIWVFFLAPGPLTFDLFAHGGSVRNWIWMGVVLLGTGIALVFGQLPGAEPAPYILRFTEDRPNPLYRRVCYTFAWNAAINFALLNLAGTALAAFTGTWYLKQIYNYAYAPICAIVLLLGILGKLPRVGVSTKGEGRERRYFYGTVWAASVGQTVLLILWKTLPRTQEANMVKLLGYIVTLIVMAFLAANGKLHRTKPILPGDVIAD
jgi:hypothetical protein